MPIPDYAAWQSIMTSLALDFPNLKVSDQALIPASAFGCIGWPHAASFSQQELPRWDISSRVLMVNAIQDARTPLRVGKAAAPRVVPCHSPMTVAATSSPGPLRSRALSSSTSLPALHPPMAPTATTTPAPPLFISVVSASRRGGRR